jgi:hypothetical protein
MPLVAILEDLADWNGVVRLMDIASSGVRLFCDLIDSYDGGDLYGADLLAGMYGLGAITQFENFFFGARPLLKQGDPVSVLLLNLNLVTYGFMLFHGVAPIMKAKGDCRTDCSRRWWLRVRLP